MLPYESLLAWIVIGVAIAGVIIRTKSRRPDLSQPSCGWVALRREKIDVTAWHFLKIGALVMPPALLVALVAPIQ